MYVCMYVFIYLFFYFFSLASRLRCEIDRLSFETYTHNEILEIIQDRLKGLEIPRFTPQVVQLISRKTAAVTGDLRTALQICQNTLEAMRADTHALVPVVVADSDVLLYAARIIKRVVQAFQELPPIAMLRQSCWLDRAILVAMCKIVKIAGGPTDITIDMLWDRFRELIEWMTANRVEPLYPCPPLYVFESAVDRLLEHDLIQLNNAKKNKSGSSRMLRHFYTQAAFNTQGVFVHPRSAFMSLKVEMGDVLGTLNECVDEKNVANENSGKRILQLIDYVK